MTTSKDWVTRPSARRLARRAGNGGVAGKIKAIIAGGAITAAGIGGSIAAAGAVNGTETTTAGVAMAQEKGDGWRR